MKKIFVVTVLTAIVFVSNASFAATFTCSGNVTSVAINPINGTLQVNYGFGVHYLCRLHELYNGVDQHICRSWYAMYLAAQASGLTITQYYDQTAGGAQSCEQLGNWVWSNPLPFYISTTKQ